MCLDKQWIASPVSDDMQQANEMGSSLSMATVASCVSCASADTVAYGAEFQTTFPGRSGKLRSEISATEYITNGMLGKIMKLVSTYIQVYPS